MAENKYIKATIPKALREATWIKYNGKTFESKCKVAWCNNMLTPFSYEVGHNIPESKGGTLDIDNLRPICFKCNRSMGSTYTIDEFSALSKHPNDIPVKSNNIFKKFLTCYS